jgi:AraC family transcriptional regulator, regulatory protein of adaptative response / methylated-DNA-[protein]-cysteine methyltransferase
VSAAAQGTAAAVRPLHVASITTPLGTMLAAALGEGLALLEFADPDTLDAQLERLRRKLPGSTVADQGTDPGIDPSTGPSTGPSTVLQRAQQELNAYFAGTLREFGIPLAPAGTPFQQQVWQVLREIPYGATRSYGQQARLIGRPTASRAVARANGDNPIAIIVPCHRVVGGDGRLTGYGGGLWRKQALLELEQDGGLAL